MKSRRDRAIAAIREQIDSLESSYRYPDGKIYDTEIKDQIRNLKAAVELLRDPCGEAIRAYNRALDRAKRKAKA